MRLSPGSPAQLDNCTAGLRVLGKQHSGVEWLVATSATASKESLWKWTWQRKTELRDWGEEKWGKKIRSSYEIMQALWFQPCLIPVLFLGFTATQANSFQEEFRSLLRQSVKTFLYNYNLDFFLLTVSSIMAYLKPWLCTHFSLHGNWVFCSNSNLVNSC